MSMTRTDFENIAEAIGKEFASEPVTRSKVTLCLAGVCKRSNSNFTKEKFIARIEDYAKKASSSYSDPYFVLAKNKGRVLSKKRDFCEEFFDDDKETILQQ